MGGCLWVLADLEACRAPRCTLPSLVNLEYRAGPLNPTDATGSNVNGDGNQRRSSEVMKFLNDEGDDDNNGLEPLAPDPMVSNFATST